ncbi:MAG: thiamine pyrophosphate-binding protein [Microthrixaceae bacterium]
MRGAPDHLAQLLVALGFDHAAVVPGTPATELQDALAEVGATVVDVGNERSAAEHAFGRSAAGRPGLVVVKGVGAWVAAEPVLNMVVHGIGAPILVVVGDDVAALHSTVPTDFRPFGPIASAPVVEVASGAGGRRAIEEAVTASHALSRPVILRWAGPIPDVGVMDRGVPAPTWRVIDPLVAHRWTKRSRHERAVFGWEDAASTMWSPPEPTSLTGGFGVIAAGAPADLAAAHAPDLPLLPLGLVHPLPAAVRSFVDRLDAVVVLEEGLPMIEDAVRLIAADRRNPVDVFGRRSGHLSAGLMLDRDEVELLLSGRPGSGRRREVPLSIAHGPAKPTEFDTVLEALRRVVDRTGIPVHTCVGSCVAAGYEPYGFTSTALELGAPIAVANGSAAADGEAAIALIGDYGLLNFALGDHDQVYRTGAPVLTVVLANGSSDKTGGQPTACSTGVSGGDTVELVRVLTRVADPARVVVWRVDDLDPDSAAEVIDRSLGELPSTLVFTARREMVARVAE